jgi:hypothetical protein
MVLPGWHHEVSALVGDRCFSVVANARSVDESARCPRHLATTTALAIGCLVSAWITTPFTSESPRFPQHPGTPAIAMSRTPWIRVLRRRVEPGLRLQFIVLIHLHWISNERHRGFADLPQQHFRRTRENRFRMSLHPRFEAPPASAQVSEVRATWFFGRE